MMFVVVPLFVLSVIGFGPRFLANGTGGIFVEGLPAELGAAVAHVHGFGVAALFDHRSQAEELGHLGGALKAVALGAKGLYYQKTRLTLKMVVHAASR